MSAARRLGPMLGIALIVAGVLLPLWWALVASLSAERRLFSGVLWWPAETTAEHYLALFDQRAFWQPIQNSLVVAGATTLLCVSIGSLCAYALARLKFRGRNLVLGFVLAVSMFPQISIVAPLFLLLRELGLINTYPGLILPYITFAMPLTVWLLVGYFRQLPSEIEQAALVDGASRLTVFRRVVVPLALPGVATTAILTFIYCFNEFLFALTLTVGPERHTVPVAIALFRGRYQVPWGEILAAAMVATTPVVLLVLGFQRRIVRGLTAGGLKG